MRATVFLKLHVPATVSARCGYGQQFDFDSVNISKRGAISSTKIWHPDWVALYCLFRWPRILSPLYSQQLAGKSIHIWHVSISCLRTTWTLCSCASSAGCAPAPWPERSGKGSRGTHLYSEECTGENPKIFLDTRRRARVSSPRQVTPR